MTFHDKVVLVAGGTSGIGRATALLFSRLGARVVIAGRRAEPGQQVVAEIREAGGVAEVVQADVGKAADVERLVAAAVQAFGRLDVAFNNAAAVEGAAFLPTADFTEADYDRSMETNLKSVWLCMKHEIKQMLAQSPPGGVIVNTSSVNGLGGGSGAALYSAAKAGVLALTKSAAQEYATQGIRVNALAAGAFRTPMLEGVFETAGGGTPDGRKAVEAAYDALIPMRRIGRPEEAAEAVVWLCSDAASYVTGHSMIVDGGMTAAVR
ncbi:MAG: glucose 1-dehydrogenase [Gemmatimonadota bacterium]